MVVNGEVGVGDCGAGVDVDTGGVAVVAIEIDGSVRNREATVTEPELA